MKFDELFPKNPFKDIPFESLPVEIGKLIQKMRVAKQLTQKDLAQKANISLKAVKNLEEGKGANLNSFLSVLYAMEESKYLLQLLSIPHFNNPDQSFLFGNNKTTSKRYKRGLVC
jgi:transcriptional regulator with XRE-family HTH domain